MDFAGSLGVPEGRFLVRRKGRDPDVLVIEERRARPPKRPRFRSAGGVDPPDPEIGFTRATIALAGDPLDDEEAIGALESRLKDRDARSEYLEGAMSILNRAIHATSVARVKAQICERSLEDTISVKWGYGTGEELAAGNHSVVFGEQAAKPKSRRQKADDSIGQERLAACLAGHEEPDALETLILRARLDINAHRYREAALMIAPAVVMLNASPSHRTEEPERDRDEERSALLGMTDELGEIASDALRRPPGQVESERIREACERAERVLRQRKLRRG